MPRVTWTNHNIHAAPVLSLRVFLPLLGVLIFYENMFTGCTVSQPILGNGILPGWWFRPGGLGLQARFQIGSMDTRPGLMFGVDAAAAYRDWLCGEHPLFMLPRSFIPRIRNVDSLNLILLVGPQTTWYIFTYILHLHNKYAILCNIYICINAYIHIYIYIHICICLIYVYECMYLYMYLRDIRWYE